jgi:hypothetical protein
VLVRYPPAPPPPPDSAPPPPPATTSNSVPTEVQFFLVKVPEDVKVSVFVVGVLTTLLGPIIPPFLPAIIKSPMRHLIIRKKRNNLNHLQQKL